LLVAHLFQPIDGFTVELFLDREMCHRCRWTGSVPVFFSRRKPDDVTRPDLFDRAAQALRPALAPTTRAGSGASNNMSTRTTPVK
jgi:hypothetical protein